MKLNKNLFQLISYISNISIRFYLNFIQNSLRDPVYREEEESFNLWWTKTPLGRRCQKAAEVEAQAKLEKESGADKKRRK